MGMRKAEKTYGAGWGYGARPNCCRNAFSAAPYFV